MKVEESKGSIVALSLHFRRVRHQRICAVLAQDTQVFPTILVIYWEDPW
jgi:hypothetical protein